MAYVDIISLTIVLGTTPVPQQGFDLLVAGYNAAFPERLRAYSSAAEALADTVAGFSSTDAEIEALTVAFSQDNKPTRVWVGRLDTPVAQVDDVTVDAAPAGAGDIGDTYTIDIDGTAYTFTVVTGAETTTNIRDALVAAINGGSNPVTAAPIGAAEFTITGDQAGVGFTTTLAGTEAASMTLTLTTANVGVADGLNAIIAEDADSWYGLCLLGEPAAAGKASCSAEFIDATSTIIESLDKIFVAQTSDAGVPDSLISDDIASTLQASGLERTSLHYHSDPDEYLAVGLAADRLAVDPDVRSTIWSFLTVRNVAVDTGVKSTTVQTTLDGKNCNYYGTWGGSGTTLSGIMSGGRKVDVRITADWLKFRLTEDIQAKLKEYSQRGSKIAYDDPGIGVFDDLTRARLKQGVNVKHLASDPEPTTTMPRRRDIPPATIAARLLEWTFNAEPAGAIEKTAIVGTVAIPL